MDMFFLKSWISLASMVILTFSCLFAETLYQKNDCKTKIEDLDMQIKYLEDLKLGLEGRAIRYENQAQRLQFDKDQLLEAKRFWNMADQNRKAAAELEQKIQEKKKERQQVIEKNNCKDAQASPSSMASESSSFQPIDQLKEKKTVEAINESKEKKPVESNEIK
jgi:hypothetical protein